MSNQACPVSPGRNGLTALLFKVAPAFCRGGTPMTIERQRARGESRWRSHILGIGGLRAGLIAVFFWLAALTCHPVQAQSFGPPVRSEVILEFFDSQHNVKFTLAAYYTSWQNPFRTTITTVSPALGFQRVSRTVRIVGDTPASPLLEGTYTISKQWRVGFWYNPIRGEKIRQMVQVVDVPVTVNLERDTDLMDLHVVYYGPRGLSAQLGYYRESGTIMDRS